MLISMAGLGSSCATLSMDQIYSIARSAGFPPDTAVTMTAIAMRESSGCPTAHNPGNPIGAEDSYGLWQINVKGNPGILTALGIKATDLYDPSVNAAAAFRLWGGNDANLNTAWYINRPVYRENYLKYMAGAQLAADRVEPQGSPYAPDDTGSAQPILAGMLGGSVAIGGVDVPVAVLAVGAAGLLALVLALRREG